LPAALPRQAAGPDAPDDPKRPGHSTHRPPSVAFVVPVWDRLDGCVVATRDMAHHLRERGATVEVYSLGPAVYPGATQLCELADVERGEAYSDLLVTTLYATDRLPLEVGGGALTFQRWAVYMHGPSSWPENPVVRSSVDAWLIPSRAYDWERHCPGWPPSRPVVEVEPGFDPRMYPQAGPTGRAGVLVVDGSQQKGGQTVVRVAGALPDLSFTVVPGGGSSPHPTLFELPNVTILPRQELDLSPLYRSASVLLHPTWSETFGRVLLEAQASGCPVVCTDLPVLRRTLAGAQFGGDTAAFVRPRDLPGWIGAIRRLVDERGAPREPAWMRLHREGLRSAWTYDPGLCLQPLWELANGT